MVQFNLLPDVKLQYVKAKRTKYMMSFISFIAGGAALGILLFSLFVVHVVQKKNINDLNTDIKKYSTDLKNTKDLDKILTVQNQLNTLTGLHETKPVTSRVFTYIGQLTPADTSLDKLVLDFNDADPSLTVGGVAPSFDAIKLYADTFKRTQFTETETNSKDYAFTNVVLTTFAKTDKGTSFTLKMKYHADIFDVKKNVTLVVPTTATTNQTNLFGASE